MCIGAKIGRTLSIRHEDNQQIGTQRAERDDQIDETVYNAQNACIRAGTAG